MAAYQMKYVALGDSIARGKGAKKREGYVYLFHRFLMEQYGNVALSNQAISGIGSRGMLAQLHLNPAVRRAVREADIMTISIGGNNLLAATSRNYHFIHPYQAKQGIALFCKQWPLLLSTIRERLNAKATLYVINLYNPYRSNEPNYATADMYIKQINAEIGNSKYIKRYKYQVVPIYSTFKGQLDEENWKTCAYTHFCQRKRDPHPTRQGYQEIFQVHKKLHLAYANEGG
ncbi:hypothetical protein JQN58_39080 [Aneurinibacillus sp. BA2021]|nr:hypothetical protein [Aneurinibacillus sp. BA2021]